MRENRIKLILASLFSIGIVGTCIYFMNATLIEGSTADETAASSSEEPKGEVTTTSTSDTGSDSTESTVPPSEEAAQAETETTESETIIPTEVHTVQVGETLWDIAQDSGMSIQDLMNENQLSSSAIVAGQDLAVAK